MDKRTLHLYITAAAAGTILAGFCLAHFICPDRALSEGENRALQSLPAPTLSTVTDGRFEGDFENYWSDQFPLRQEWIYMKTGSEYLLGKRESGGVFLGTDGRLLKRFTAPDESHYDSTARALQQLKLASGKRPFYFMLSPTAVSVYPEYLPPAADPNHQGIYLDRIYRVASRAGLQTIDLRGVFEENKWQSKLFYHTDHHWTADGVRLAFEAYAQAAELDITDLEYERLPVSDTFTGTLAATYGRPADGEEIAVIRAEDSPAVIVTYPESGEKRYSLFDTAKLDTHDQYALFLGGNFPTVSIRTGAKGGQRLLIIKDSYANAMIPLLSRYYARITLVDPRYFHGDFAALLESEDPDALLYLGNADTFAESTLKPTK